MMKTPPLGPFNVAEERACAPHQTLTGVQSEGPERREPKDPAEALLSRIRRKIARIQRCHHRGWEFRRPEGLHRIKTLRKEDLTGSQPSQFLLQGWEIGTLDAFKETT